MRNIEIRGKMGVNGQQMQEFSGEDTHRCLPCSNCPFLDSVTIIYMAKRCTLFCALFFVTGDIFLPGSWPSIGLHFCPSGSQFLLGIYASIHQQPKLGSGLKEILLNLMKNKDNHLRRPALKCDRVQDRSQGRSC